MVKAIKNWRQEERPREKLMLKGADALTSAELIAILLRTGSRKETAVDMARTILDSVSGNLSSLSSMSLEQLTSLDGVGSVKAVTLMAAFELGRRLCSAGGGLDPQVNGPSVVVTMLAPYLKDLRHEECWVVFLNRSNKIIGREKLSSGGVSATIMDTRMIVKRAVERLASAIILVHNHPSGNPLPGDTDRQQTILLKEAASLFDIALLDHIIIAGNKYYSFSDENINFTKLSSKNL